MPAAMIVGGTDRATSSRRWEYVILGSGVVALVVLIVLPLVSLLKSSFVADAGGIGLMNFYEVVTEPLYYNALFNSLKLGFWVGVLSVCIGVPFAWAVSRTNVPGKRFIHLTAIISYLSPAFLTAIAYVNMFSPNSGLVNVFLRDVLHMPFLTFNVFSMTGLVLVTTLGTFPFVYLLTSSALQSVDASYEEAAQILGCGRWRTALTITLPLVAPAIVAGTLLAFVHAIALFGSQAIIGLPARIPTLPTRIYSLFDYPPQNGVASALSLAFVLITVTALYLQRRFLARRSYVTLGGKGSRPQLVDLGFARWFLFGFCVLVFLISVLIPFATLIAVSFSKTWGLDFWNGLTLANYKYVLIDYAITRKAIVNSLILATVAATCTIFIGAIVSWIDLRTKFPSRQILDYIALVPLGLPGIVMAVALLQFWLSTPFALYGTMAILLLAYVGRYVPLGVRAASTSLRQIDSSLEESARILGAPWVTTAREITLPLMRPGLFAGWLLVFVPVIQELSASILLFSSDTITLAVAVYNLFESGYTEPVAALAIVNMVIIGGAIWLATKLGGGRLGKTSVDSPKIGAA